MKDDLSALSAMKYSGRGIIIGVTPLDEIFIGYSLTGRSPSSQARRLVLDGQNQAIFTEPLTDDTTLRGMFKIADDAALAKLKQDISKGSPALIYYPAIIAVDDFLVASNGVQTDLFYSAARKNPKLDSSEVLDNASFPEQWRYDPQGKRFINITSYEPDAPNNTARICGCIKNDGSEEANFLIIRYLNSGEGILERGSALNSGEGSLITTYKGGNESPLLPTDGNLLEVKIDSLTAADIAESIYQSQIGGSKPGDNFRVAAAVMLRKKEGTLETKIINRADRGE